jgi:endonuclease YncB( thermonuclease family)
MGNCCFQKKDKSKSKELYQANLKTTPSHSLEGQILQGVVLDCYDGDTCTIAMSAYNNQIELFKCRLIGIDTPEMKTTNEKEKLLAIQARNFLISKVSTIPYTEELFNRSQVQKHLSVNKLEITVHCGKPDKYGRLLVSLYSSNSLSSINTQLICAGLAKEYNGKTKDTNW